MNKLYVRTTGGACANLQIVEEAMADYAAWRGIEKEFRDLHRDHPELVAEGDTIHNQWVIRGSAEGASGEDHLAGLTELAAQAAGHQGTEGMNYWLSLVRDYLIERTSKNIERFPIASAGGLPAVADVLPVAQDGSTDRWKRDDRRIKRGEVCTLRPVCQASADYCLERAKQCQRAEANERLRGAAARDAQKRERVRGRVKATDVTKKLMPPPGNASKEDWQGIEIWFLSDERVQIRNGTETETRNYDEMGFVDRRSGKPDKAWEALRALAELDGRIRDGAKMGGRWTKVEKRMQVIRRRLRNHFGVPADPLPFVAGTGYQALFKIRCSPSFSA